jgi:hypothetical protein
MIDRFRELWAADFEYRSTPGNRPDPVCLVARELRSGREVRLWRDEFGPAPPYPTDRDSLFVAYHASAETGCHLALGWPLPEAVLDLEAEFRCATTGYRVMLGKGLIGAMAAHGLDTITCDEKSSTINLILRGGGHAPEERTTILDYCASDTDALARLLPRMLPGILARPTGLELALWRGRYSGHAVAAMEHNGIPIDRPTWTRLRARWDAIRARLVAAIDPAFGVYDGVSFRADRFADYLRRHDLPWPQLADGDLDLKDQTFRDMAEMYPQVEPLRQLRHTLSQLRVHDLAVGDDDRNRCMLGQFVASSGRNAPKASAFIFGPSTWLRGLIKPPPGRAVAYLDWSGQEVGIAAGLSGDVNLLEAVASGDPYIFFAKMAGMVPDDATKDSHPAARDVCKRCMLGVNYGMAARTLAFRIRAPLHDAEDLLRQHRAIFPRFWEWSGDAVRVASLFGYLDLAFGWRVHDGPDTSPTSLMNAPMQGNGSEMMRLAAIGAVRSGIQVDAVIHDAFLVEGDVDQIEDTADAMSKTMARASALVLGGHELRTDAKIIRHPDRYMDPRDGAKSMWDLVTKSMVEVKDEDVGASTARRPPGPGVRTRGVKAA